MEEILDLIAEDKADWQKTLSDFYTPFMKSIEEGKKNIKSLKVVVPTGEKCPECGEELVKRKGRYGEFISCSAFPKCKYTKNLGKTEKKAAVIVEGVKCPDCGGDIVERFSRRGKFYGCVNYPKCKFVSTYQPTNKKCPECGEMMVTRELRKKQIFECTKCKLKEDA